MARSFQNGLAAVHAGPQRWGYIDRQGAMVIEPRFTDAHPFSDGLALVKEGERAGFIDRSGRVRIDVPAIYRAKPFSHGRAMIGDSDSGYTYIDTEGKQAIEERFATASPFFHGLAHVKRICPVADARLPSQRSLGEFRGDAGGLQQTGVLLADTGDSHQVCLVAPSQDVTSSNSSLCLERARPPGLAPALSKSSAVRMPTDLSCRA